MKKALSGVLAIAILVTIVLIVVPQPASSACYKCEYRMFLGVICVTDFAGGGKTGCNDTQTCGVFGSSCTGSGGTGGCIEAPDGTIICEENQW